MKKFQALVLAVMMIFTTVFSVYAVELRPGLINITSGQSVGDGSYINRYSGGSYPFRMSFTLDEHNMPGQSCRVGIYAWDCDWDNTYHDYEYDMVFVNDTFVGVLTGQDDTWKTSYFDVPLEVLRMGENVITVYVGEKIIETGEVIRDSSGWLLTIDWATVQMDGGKSNNAPESFTLTLTDASETAAGGIVCTAEATIQTDIVRSYVIEYSLINKTAGTAGYNQIVAGDEEQVSGTSIVSNGHFFLPADAARGAYLIEATLRDSMTNTIYAYASYNFNMEEALTGGCDHVSTESPKLIRTNYYRLDKEHAQYHTHHNEVDTYFAICQNCGKVYYTYSPSRSAEHTYPVCQCGYVEEGYNVIQSAQLYPLGNCVAGEDFCVEVITHESVYRLTAVNDLGTSLNDEKWVVEHDAASGTKLWKRIYRADLPASNRYWTLKAYNSNGHYLNSAQTNSIKIGARGEICYMPVEIELNAAVEVVEDAFKVPELQGVFAPARTHVTAAASVKGGSGSFAYTWTVEEPNGKLHTLDARTAEMEGYFDYWNEGEWSIRLTVTDTVTGEQLEEVSQHSASCSHKVNGETRLVRQKNTEWRVREDGHMLSYVDVCSLCSARVLTDGSVMWEPHYFQSDDYGVLTCVSCDYEVTPETFAEAASIPGSPAYRIYNDKVFPMHSKDGLFRSTASSVIEHRVNDKFLVYLEEAYDVLDNEDFEDTEKEIQKNIVYETLQDLLCERADETMMDAIDIAQVLEGEAYGEEIAEEALGLGVEAVNNAVGNHLKLNDFETSYVGAHWSSILAVVGVLVDSAAVVDATQEELAKIAFCLANCEATEEALATMKETMPSDYHEIIDELRQENKDGMWRAVANKSWDAAGLIAELGAQSLIELSAFTYSSVIINGIAENSHQLQLQAYRSGKSVAEITQQMRVTAGWQQVAQGIDVAASIYAGIKIGHAIGGAADQQLLAQDQLMLILPYEMDAYSEMFNAYHSKSDMLYEVSCIYLETLKEGYKAAKAMYDAHNTAFAKFFESKEETEACISLSKHCQTKMESIDDYIQLLNEESSKYER